MGGWVWRVREAQYKRTEATEVGMAGQGRRVQQGQRVQVLLGCLVAVGWDILWMERSSPLTASEETIIEFGSEWAKEVK